jgi:nitrous oxidase accessory protein NosD
MNRLLELIHRVFGNMANTKQSYYVAISTGVNYKFSGTKTIYTAALAALLGIATTAAETAKVFSGPASNFGVTRIRVKYIKSGSGDTAIYAVGTVLCAPSKLEEALSGLRTQTYKGKNIVDAYLARRRIYI